MDNNDMRVLVETFKGYRDLLAPVQANLSEFVDTYDTLRSDIEKLDSVFGGDVRDNLQKIYRNLSNQADKATDLASRIDQFMKVSSKYMTEVTTLISVFEKIEDKLESVNEIERTAEAQLSKLETILEEKRRTYNLKDLQRTLENYNANVQRVSEFINKDVVESISASSKKLDAIRQDNDNLAKMLDREGKAVDVLVETNQTTSQLLKNTVEGGAVNEAYIFDILDKWADARKVRTKK